MNFIDIFKNYPLSRDYSETYSDYKIKQSGGNNDNNTPSGGFPPIYVCKKKQSDGQSILSDDTKKREFEVNPNIVSIKTILEKRRQNIPVAQKRIYL